MQYFIFRNDKISPPPLGRGLIISHPSKRASSKPFNKRLICTLPFEKLSIFLLIEKNLRTYISTAMLVSVGNILMNVYL